MKNVKKVDFDVSRFVCVEIGFEVFLLLLNCQVFFVVARSIDGAR